MKFKQNFCDLIADAHKFQSIGISDISVKGIKSKKLIYKLFHYFSPWQWIIILFSLVISLFISNGLGNDFAGYIISGLSLFVGIFFTFIITLYDKFKNINFSQYDKNISEEKNIIGIRLKNFFKKVTVLALYSIVLSIICILLLSITLLFNDYLCCSPNIILFFTNISQSDCCEIFKFCIIKLYETTVFYFLFDFLLITLYLISSIYDFIISEYNQIKLS